MDSQPVSSNNCQHSCMPACQHTGPQCPWLPQCHTCWHTKTNPVCCQQPRASTRANWPTSAESRCVLGAGMSRLLASILVLPAAAVGNCQQPCPMFASTQGHIFRSRTKNVSLGASMLACTGAGNCSKTGCQLRAEVGSG